MISSSHSFIICRLLPFSIWVHYQRLATCIRRGSSTAEASLFAPYAPPCRNSNARCNAKTSSGMVAQGWRDGKEESEDTTASSEDKEVVGESTGASTGTLVDNPLSGNPCADHALAYTVLSTGLVIVALATIDSELYVTFPGHIDPMDASQLTDLLSRRLNEESSDLFQESN